MPSLKDWKPGSVFQCLVVSPFKGGKTWGAGTFPRPNFMDFDHGIATLRNPAWVAKYGLRDIQYEQFSEKGKTEKGIPVTHNAFDDACKYFDKYMAPDLRDSFDTWVVDSGTTLSEFAAIKAMILLGGSGLGQTSKTHAQAKATGLVIPKMQDYGAERSMVEQFIDMVKDSGKNFVFLCHEKQLMNEAGVITAIVPLLTGKSAESIPLKFDEVYHLKLNKVGMETKRTLQTQADTVRRCGSRIGIPDGTSWDWDSLQAELSKIRLAQVQPAITPTPVTSIQR